MRLLHTLYEYETKNLDLGHSEIALLERLNKAFDAPVLRPTFKEGRTAVQASQYVGVFRFGDRTIQVLPKIYRAQEGHNKEKQSEEATRNLLYMLGAAGQLPTYEYDLAPLLRAGHDWFEILTHLFAKHLTKEWQHGVHRYYQTVEEELPLLKGKWHIGDQLRRPERKHIFSVIYDEFSADTQLNRVFRYVVERLWWLTRDRGNRQLLGTLRQWMDEVKLMPIVTAADAHPALITRLNVRYQPLLNMARLFLGNNAVQLTRGTESIYTFVIDMNVLFESFIANFIRAHRQAILPPSLLECDVLTQAAGASYNLAWLNGKLVFRLKPDLAFRQDGEFHMILDTKYKRLDFNYASGVGMDDFVQMYVYAQRYDCERVILLYPQTEQMAKRVSSRFKLEDSTKHIIATTVDLRVPLDRREGRETLQEELRIILGDSYADN